jgi:protein-L-isoaspartate(D-aspartate) O-methyltransferase
MDFDVKRRQMVEEQLKSRDIVDARVLKATLEVPRHEFVPPEFREISYGDFPIPITQEQTISQPYIVALMTQELQLKPDDKVLEIGAGSGYQAAILSRLVKKVYTIERVQQLAEHAEMVLKKLCYLNVEISVGDGTLGLTRHAPYDAIIVTAAAKKVPSALKEQLKEGGRMIIPVGDRFEQVLVSITKQKGEFIERKICGCTFVPLVGKDGWKE